MRLRSQAMPAPDFADPIPAATLVLFRESGAGAPELLFVERAATMVFAGGALVFPGGRIDPGDVDFAARALPGDPHGPARIAAIRETIEETGIAVGLYPLPDWAATAAIRAALHAGARIAEILGDHRLTVDASALTPFARWCPRHADMRIFDTMFFVAALPVTAPAPVVDATENSRSFWSSAQAVLDDADRGAATIIFPTRRNLERLARFADLGEAVADAMRHGTPIITPWVETRGGAPHVCIPDDCGYPITAEATSAARRA